jgi:hypothetical protein
VHLVTRQSIPGRAHVGTFASGGAAKRPRSGPANTNPSTSLVPIAPRLCRQTLYRSDSDVLADRFGHVKARGAAFWHRWRRSSDGRCPPYVRTCVRHCRTMGPTGQLLALGRFAVRSPVVRRATCGSLGPLGACIRWFVDERGEPVQRCASTRSSLASGRSAIRWGANRARLFIRHERTDEGGSPPPRARASRLVLNARPVMKRITPAVRPMPVISAIASVIARPLGDGPRPQATRVTPARARTDAPSPMGCGMGGAGCHRPSLSEAFMVAIRALRPAKLRSLPSQAPGWTCRRATAAMPWTVESPMWTKARSRRAGAPGSASRGPIPRPE